MHQGASERVQVSRRPGREATAGGYCFYTTNLFVIHKHIVDNPGTTYDECIKKAN